MSDTNAVIRLGPEGPELDGLERATFRSVEMLITRAEQEVRLLGAVTPREAHTERVRLVDALERRRSLTPRWTYAPCSHAQLRRALDAAERLQWTSSSALEETYRGRLRELSFEAAMSEAAGTPSLGTLARERYASFTPESSASASAMCVSWLRDQIPRLGGDQILSDSRDPRSLLSRIESAIGAARLPFSVVPSRALSALAATGRNVILVASGRMVSVEDALRTTIHEVEGHARPRARAESAPLAIFRVGTARGVDDQEGRALVLEKRAGLLGAARRRQLGLRHWAVMAMRDGASFGDVAIALVDDHGLPSLDAVVIAERAFRGSDGTTSGLGREGIYLEAFVRVDHHLALHPSDEDVLAAGQVSLDAVGPLRGWISKMSPESCASTVY